MHTFDIFRMGKRHVGRNNPGENRGGERLLKGRKTTEILKSRIIPTDRLSLVSPPGSDPRSMEYMYERDIFGVSQKAPMRGTSLSTATMTDPYRVRRCRWLGQMVKRLTYVLEECLIY